MDLDLFLYIWTIVGVIIAIIGTFMTGYQKDNSDPVEDVMGFIVLAVMWPLLIIIGMMVAPFYLILKLGSMARKRSNQ